MPIPTPTKDEDHDDFMARCMGDDTMVDEYPDDDQRYAVCQQQWDDKDEEKAAKPSLERRILAPDDVELRVAPDDKGNKHLVGYAARFNKLSLDLGGFKERIKPGAFTKAIKDADIRGLKNHNPDLLLGRTVSETLVLTENSRGLKFDDTLPDTTIGRDTAEEVIRGDLTGCSFSFWVDEDEWEEKKDGSVTRTILSFREVYDVGPVTFPAYPDTSVAVRSLEAWREARTFEQSDTKTPKEQATDVPEIQEDNEQRQGERPNYDAASKDIAEMERIADEGAKKAVFDRLNIQ